MRLLRCLERSGTITTSHMVRCLTGAALGFCLAQLAAGHTRLECPPPRSKETGAKTGPCDAPDNPALPAFPLSPGLNTVTWLESIGHPGAPARFALSLDGSDKGFESCILLDHVPHDERSRPSFSNEATHHRSSITLFVPDVRCERCHLQLITVMSDDYHGVPDGQSCALPAAQSAGKADSSMLSCSAVYHSCAPVRINGTVPRAQHTCSLTEHEAQLGWPFMAGKPPASTYFFKGDPGLYSQDTAQLQSGGAPIKGCSDTYCDPAIYFKKNVDVPPNSKYTRPAGSCARVDWASECCRHATYARTHARTHARARAHTRTRVGWCLARAWTPGLEREERRTDKERERERARERALLGNAP